MGRPSVTLDEAQKAEVETLAAVLSVQQIADYFGIARSTFFTLINRDPEIARHYHRGRARAIGSIAQSLITKARSGDTASMIFYLKTQAGWRETAPLEMMAPDMTYPITAGITEPVVLDAAALAEQAMRLGIDPRHLGLVEDEAASGQGKGSYEPLPQGRDPKWSDHRDVPTIIEADPHI
jgi:DNA-binding CsgD family transcriptional regulator